MRKLLGQVKEMFSCGGSKNFTHEETAQQIDLGKPITQEYYDSLLSSGITVGNDKDGLPQKRISKAYHSSTHIMSELQTSETLCIKIEREDSDLNRSFNDSNKVRISSRQLETSLKQAKILLNSSTAQQPHQITDKDAFNLKPQEKQEKPIQKSVTLPRKPPKPMSKPKQQVVQGVKKEAPKTVKHKKKVELVTNLTKQQSEQTFTKPKLSLTAKSGQQKKINFKEKNKTRTVEIEVNNVDIEILEESASQSVEDQFIPSSQSTFTFKPKFYKPTQVVNNSCQSSMVTMRNLSNSTPEIKMQHQTSDTTQMKSTTLFGEDFNNSDQL